MEVIRTKISARTVMETNNSKRLNAEKKNAASKRKFFEEFLTFVRNR
jgi:hypothetical protein